MNCKEILVIQWWIINQIKHGFHVLPHLFYYVTFGTFVPAACHPSDRWRCFYLVFISSNFSLIFVIVPESWLQNAIPGRQRRVCLESILWLHFANHLITLIYRPCTMCKGSRNLEKPWLHRLLARLVLLESVSTPHPLRYVLLSNLADEPVFDVQISHWISEGCAIWQSWLIRINPNCQCSNTNEW